MRDKRTLWKALKRTNLDQDRIIVTMSAILLSTNGLGYALEFVNSSARRRLLNELESREPIPSDDKLREWVDWCGAQA